MAKSEAPAERTGRRLLEVPRGGRRGVGPIPGPRRQLWLPWPSLGPGSVRPWHPGATGSPHQPEEQLPPASGA